MMPKPPPYRPLISSVPPLSRAVAQLCEPSPRVAAGACFVNHLAACVRRGGSLGGLLLDEVPRAPARSRGAAAGRELVGKGSTRVTASAPSTGVGLWFVRSAIVARPPAMSGANGLWAKVQALPGGTHPGSRA